MRVTERDTPAMQWMRITESDFRASSTHGKRERSECVRENRDREGEERGKNE